MLILSGSYIKLILCRSLVFIAFFAIFSLVIAPRAMAEGKEYSRRSTTVDTDYIVQVDKCDWKSSSRIVCADLAFYFDPITSIQRGYAVFALSKDQIDLVKGGEMLYLHVNMSKTDQLVLTNRRDETTSEDPSAWIAIANSDQESLLLEIGIAKDGEAGNFETAETVSADDVSNQNIKQGWRQYQGDGEKHSFICGLYTRNGHECWAMYGSEYGHEEDSVKKITISDPGNTLETIQEKLGSYISTRDDCGRDAGSLGFVLCPVLTAVTKAINDLIGTGSGRGFLVELLTMRPLEKEVGSWNPFSHEETDLYKIWRSLRDVALGFYVVIFVLIIFGNGLGFDPYTIKRALPRLAVSVLLTWSSFFIMQTLVDLSNLLGTAVPSLLSAVTGNSGVSSYNFDMNFGDAGLTIILVLVLSFAALGALLIGVAGLIARSIILFGLVLLAPLAFAAWVLPNTESLFKKWWKNLIKVLMMFPIVTGMLATSLLFQASVEGADSLPLKISGAIAPLIAIILIPKTFKWGGEVFAATAGYLAGKAQGTGDKIKDMPGAAGRKAAGSVSKGVLASEKAQKAATAMASNRAGKFIGGAALLRKTQGAKSERLKAGANLVEDMNDDQIARVAKNGNFQERVAASKELIKRGKGEGLGKLLRGESGKGAATSAQYALKSYGREGKAMGSNLLTYENGKFNADKTAKKIQNMSADALISELGDDAFEEIADKGTLMGHDLGVGGDGRALLDRQLREVRSSPSLYSKASLKKQQVIGPPIAGSGGTGSGGTGSSPGGGGAGSGPAGNGSGSPGGGPTRPGPTGGAGSPGGSPFGGGGSPRPSGGSGSGSSGGGPIPHTPTSPPPPPAGGAPTYSTPTGAPRYTTGGVPIPPPPSSSTPSWSAPPPSSSTPPPFRGTPPPPSSSAPPRPAPPPAPTPGGGGALPSTPSSSGASSGGGTVINNVTNEVSNNVTNNVSTSRDVNQASPVGSIGGPTTIPSGALGDLSRQIGRMMSRTGSSAGLASLESKISTLQDMIVREGRNSNNVKNLLRTMREEAGSLPSHEQGAAEDALNNFEHQSGINGPESSGGAGSGDI